MLEVLLHCSRGISTILHYISSSTVLSYNLQTTLHSPELLPSPSLQGRSQSRREIKDTLHSYTRGAPARLGYTENRVDIESRPVMSCHVML